MWQKLKYTHILMLVMVFYSFILISPIVYNIGLKGSYSSIIAIFIIFISTVAFNKKIKVWFLTLFSIVFVLSLISSWYWQNLIYGLFPISLVAAAFVLQSAKEKDILIFANLATYVILIQLVGAAFGYFLAYYGVSPLFTFKNPDGREAYFFYSTFTNVYYAGFIRPSGIYDEPGTLSMLVCCVATLRHALKMDKKITWIMLILGIVTSSLALFVYIIFHLASEKYNSKKGLTLALVSLALLSLVLSVSNVPGKIIDKVSGRLEVSSSGTIEGDNRTWRLKNSLAALSNDNKVILFGIDPICTLNYNECKKIYPQMGENPLSPISLRGLLLTWGYYVFIFILLATVVLGRHNLTYTGIALIFMQKPYVMNSGFSLLSLVILYLAFNEFAKRSLFNNLLRMPTSVKGKL